MAGTTYGYTYDSNGNILTISKNGALAESYVYDGLNQLVRENSVTQNKTVVYEYDNRGNITSKKTYAYTAGEITGTPTDEVVYSYNNSQWKDMLTVYDGENITYDDIGNPLSYRNGISFTWKNGRRLASYTDGVYNITYNYTDGGIRKNKTVNGETTEYLLSGSQIMQERRPNGDILNYARDESGGLVGFDYYSAAENVINFYYYLKNMQGDIVGITDRQGNVLVTYTYDTWGKLISITGSMANTIGIINPFRYRGYYYDTETGFYYLQSRYYDPEVCRFLNADGYVSTGQGVSGYNMYAYCGNNPVNRVDSTGQFWLAALAFTSVVAICTFTLSSCSDPSNSFAKAPDLDINTAPANTYDCLGNALNKQIDSNLIGYTQGDSPNAARECVRDIVGFRYYRPLDSIDSPIYDYEYRVAVKTSDVDYHFIRETEFGWYDKPGDLAGSYVKPEYVDGAVWSCTKNIFDEEVTSYYNTDTKYFAITIGWDENG